MANTIRIKRRNTGAGGPPASLASGEMAYSDVDNTLYYGRGNNGSGVATSVIALGRYTPSLPEDFGYAGSNITSDTAAMQAWAAATGQKSLRNGQTYRINGTLSFTGAQDIDGSGATILVDANVAAISAYNAPIAVALSADYVEGATTLSVTGLSVAPPKGTKIKLHSNVRDPANRDNGASTSQYRCGEWAVLGDGSTTTTLVLAAPLRHTTGIATSSAARVPAYTVAAQTRVLLLQPAKFRMRNLRFEYSSGEAWTASVGNIDGYDTPELEGVSYGQIYGSAIGVLGNYGARVTAIAADNTVTYGIGLAGYGTSVSGATFTSCRHGITTSEATATVGTSSVTAMLRCGRVGAITVSDSISYGGDFAGFDTHHGAEDAVFVNCIVDGNADFGFQARGRNVVFNGPIVRNSGKGVLAFTEYENADGSPYLNGKEASDLTDALVISPQISCRAEPVVCSAAFMRVTGQGTYTSPDHRVFYSIGGELRISGSHYHTVQSGGGTNATGCIQVSAAAATLGGISGGSIIIEEGADVTIDARAASATSIEGLTAATGTSIVVRGTLTLLMPASPGNLLAGGGDIRTEGSGVILYSREGSDDSTMPLNRTGRDVRLVAVDGTASIARLRNEPYSSRSSMLAAKLSPGQNSLACYDGGALVNFVPSSTGTAGTMADGTALAVVGARLSDGTAASPALAFDTDTNTGLFRPAADQIGFATGGAPRALLSSSALQLDVPTVTVVPAGNSAAGIEVGGARTADGSSYIDLIGDTTYTDYGARFIRNQGVNGNTQIMHRGSGTLDLFAQDGGAIRHVLGGVQRASMSTGAFQLDVPLTGTAVTQSLTDATAGRVVTAGWMGLGATEVPDVDANATGLATRLVRFLPANGPDSGYWFGMHISRLLDAQGAQIAVRDSGSTNSLMAIRQRDSSGVWSPWNVLLGRRNAIGTVGQSDGVPTGALFEIGSGGNGRYERRASGFSAAARLDLTVTNVNTAYGALYRSADIVWTFPSAHVTGELPVIAVNAAHSDVIGFRVISISETAVTFQLVAAASITGAVTVRATASGRWSTMS